MKGVLKQVRLWTWFSDLIHTQQLSRWCKAKIIFAKVHIFHTTEGGALETLTHFLKTRYIIYFVFVHVVTDKLKMMENYSVIFLPSGLALTVVANECNGKNLSVVLQLLGLLGCSFHRYLVVVVLSPRPNRISAVHLETILVQWSSFMAFG